MLACQKCPCFLSQVEWLPTSCTACIMQWPELCLRLMLALSLQSAAGFLPPRPFLSRPNPPVAATSSAAEYGPRTAVLRRTSATARRLLLLPYPGSPLPRPRCSRLCGPLSAAAVPSATLWGGGVREERSRASSSNTALAARTGGQGLQRDGGEGGEGAEKGGGWRQRVVRTVVSIFLRIRTLVAALGARFGLGRWSKV